jgi:hypothetical protein
LKTFVISRDKASLEDSNLTSVDILVERDGLKLYTNYQVYPDRAVRIEFNPHNGIVKMEFQLQNGEFIALGDVKKD